MKRYRLLFLLGFLVSLMLACQISAQTQDSRATPTIPELVEQTAVIPAPSPTTTPVPRVVPEATESPLSCLEGTWEIANLDTYVLSAIPTEMIEKYSLEYQGTEGSAYYSFSPEGNFTLLAEHMQLFFDAKVSLFTVTLTVLVDGKAPGSYQLDGDTLTTADVDTLGMTASASAMGQDLLEPSQIISFIPLLRSPYNTASFTCAGDSLFLEVLAYPDDIPPLTFKRVIP